MEELKIQPSSLKKQEVNNEEAKEALEMNEEFKFYVEDPNNLEENKNDHLIPLASMRSPSRQKESRKKVIQKSSSKIEEASAEKPNFQTTAVISLVK